MLPTTLWARAKLPAASCCSIDWFRLTGRVDSRGSSDSNAPQVGDRGAFSPRGYMPFYRRPGLTPESASDICMNQCRAMCCRGPLILALNEAELFDFEQNASIMGVALRVTKSPDGGGWVKFSEHAGECCPMLDRATFGCRIYADRPQRCREFPEKPTVGCAISGG